MRIEDAWKPKIHVTHTLRCNMDSKTLQDFEIGRPIAQRPHHMKLPERQGMVIDIENEYLERA